MLKIIDDFVWGVPLIVLILAVGIFLTIRLRGLQITKLPLAVRHIIANEKDGKDGEVSSFGALCTALSATIGTGNIVGVATAVVAGGPGALFWMWIAALFGTATKYAECLLAIKYRVVEADGHVVGGPFYYIENGMGRKFRWLGQIFAFFGVGVGLLGIGTFTQINGITGAVKGFFDPETACSVHLFSNTYSWSVVISGLILTVCVALVIIGGIKRISSVAQVVVPFMALVYVVTVLIILLTHLERFRQHLPPSYKARLDSVQRQEEHLAQSLLRCRRESREVFSPTKRGLEVRRSLQLPRRPMSRWRRDWYP